MGGCWGYDWGLVFLLNIVGDVMISKSKERGWWARNNWRLGEMRVRVSILCLALVAGFFLAKYVSPWLLCFLGDEVHAAVNAAVATATFTSPIFLALWWFRTYDSLRSEWRANFETGVDHIANNTPTRVEVGAEKLNNVSKETSIYNREISIAFIRRLKQCPAGAEANPHLLYNSSGWGYAEQMLKWLKNQNAKFDLHYVDLRNQDFTETISGITVCDLLKMAKENSLAFDIACCSDESMKQFFGCCDYASEQYDKTEDHRRLQHHLAAGEMPSVQVGIERKGCGKQCK